jgi:hypothetical protein
MIPIGCGLTPCCKRHRNLVQSTARNPVKTGQKCDEKVTPTGLEEMPFSQGNSGVQGDSAAQSAAFSAENARILRWLDACPVDLDDATRERLRAIIGDGWPAII